MILKNHEEHFIKYLESVLIGDLIRLDLTKDEQFNDARVEENLEGYTDFVS